MNKEKYALSMIIEEMLEAGNEAILNQNDEYDSIKKEIYYEVLDTIKNRLFIAGIDEKDYGLDINLDEKFLGRSY